MDLAELREDRRRLVDAFQSTLTYLSMLRAQVLGCADADARALLQSMIDEQVPMANELSNKLLALDASILDAETRMSEARVSPLALAPLDF